MNITVEEAKKWLRVDTDDDDTVIEMLIQAAANYIKNATGQAFDGDNELARLVCLVLMSDWYENRNLTGEKTSPQIRTIVTSMITQLQYGKDV